MSIRYALYYIPSDDSRLGRFGARWFGHWPDGRAVTDTLDLPTRLQRIARVSRYGFHATLKAPFHLRDGCTEDRLLDAVAKATSCWQTTSLSGLEVAVEADTLCLHLGNACPAPEVAAVSAIAEGCVIDFEPWRAPLTDEARARRKPDQLGDRERELLDTYGYPWVLDAFRFHITLADRLHDGSDEAWARTLDALYQDLVPEPAALDRIAVCREEAPDRAFERIAEFPFLGS